MIEKRIHLGATDLLVSPLGIGAWAWGDRFFWGYGRQYGHDESAAAFQTSLAAGINFFDTAEIYGQGRSERLVGEFIRRYAGESGGPRLVEAPQTSGSEQPVIATKFAPYPWRLFPGQLERALRGSLKRLQLEQVALYQIHFPLKIRSLETWAEALAQAVQAGLTQAVGVSNYNQKQMIETQRVLQRYELPLASNQVEYSLLDRAIEANGLLETCRRENITVIAYSPLAQGLLTGKYTPANPPGGVRGRRYDARRLARIQPLIELLRTIGAEHAGPDGEAKTPAQVALNWTICKGTLPIPGAKNARQASDNIGALGWRLSGDEVARLDEASAAVQ